MGYYILLNPNSMSSKILKDRNNFPEYFSTYEQAKSEGEALEEIGECHEFMILKEQFDKPTIK